MEQMTLFDSERPYKYIMDTSSILSQKPGETHTRLVYESQWERIEEYMRSHSIVTCSEIFEEIKDKEIKEWIFSQQCTVLEIDDDIQNNVRKIVTENPKMIEFTGKSGTSSGDAFLIATATDGILMLSVWSSVLQIQRTGGNEIGSRTSDFEKRQVLRRAEL